MFGVAMEAGPKQLLSPESAAAAELFDQFVNAQTFKGVLGTFRLLCDTLRIKPTNFPNFYPKLKAKLRSWKAQALWTKIEKRANHKCYNRGKACANTRVLIIGAGPCGLRTAIEAQLLGAKVVVIEKRDRLSRNNVLHLWPFVIHDLRSLGAKKFYGKFCVGAIDHISIRQLQCVLLKVALLVGVEVHENVSFDDLVEPPLDQTQEKIGWKPLLTPRDHPVSQYEFDVLVGADGKRNTLKSFKRKEFRGKLAIAITANFINRHSEAEARVQEISGVAFIFNQKFFQDLRDHTGIDLENIVYYKDETHYFVMTAKKYSLIEKGVILNDYADTAKLLAPDNVSREALLVYAREAADFSTNFQMPDLDFAVNHYGQADVAMFDFTSMFAAESASRVIERRGHKLLQALVGDSLLEPFWPTGSGCARGFLSSLDACWMIRSWSLGCMTPFQVLAQRESIYRLLAQTTPENLSKDYNEYTVDPTTRYPNLNLNAVFPVQVKGLYDTDSDLKDEPLEIILPKKKRKRDSHIHPDALLSWCQRQVILCRNVSIENMTISWKNGLAFCAIIHRYRPDLIDFNLLKEEDAEKNNQLAFDVCEREFGILPVMTGKEMAESNVPDALAIVSYVSQIYDTFRGEIPYIARAPLTDLSPEERPTSPSRKSPSGRFSFLSRLGQRLGSKKRYSIEKMDQELEKEKADALRRAKKKRSLERDRALFILNKDAMAPTLTSYKSKTEATIEDRENFNTRVKDLEEKLYGTGQRPAPSPSNTQKVGKIGRGDWNVKMLEERLKGSKPAIKKERVEVPKWSRDIFEDKLRALDQKPRSDSPDEPAKFVAFDSKLHMLDKKLKEGNNLDIGQRGMNKVSAMAEHITSTLETRPQSLPLQRSNSKPSIPVVNVQNASEVCHFCKKRVYLMERHSAQGKFFHRGCFKCEYCNVSLRLGNYGMGTEGTYNGKFLCMHHFNMRVIPNKRPGAELGNEAKRNTKKTPTKLSPVMQFGTPPGGNLEVPDSGTNKLRGITPERVEFENTLDLTSEEELLSEIDEDDWTERNFGNTTTDMGSSDEESDFSSDEMKDEELEEALQKSLSSAQTLKLAESWKRRHSKGKGNNMEYEDEYDSDDDDYDESGEDYSYEEYENEDDESTATDGEVHDGAGEGPSEQVVSPAIEVTKDGDVQLEVPQQTNNNSESVDYRTLQSNEESGDDSGSRTSDSELFSVSDTETDSEAEDVDHEDGERGIEGDKESDGDENPCRVHRSRSKKRKHFIPTIVIDEMTVNALNEDDDSYFITLQEQNLKAEKTLGDLIHEQITDSAVQTPETPCFVQEEMCPLVHTGNQKSFDMLIYEPKQIYDRSAPASTDSTADLKLDLKSNVIANSQNEPENEITQISSTCLNSAENLTQQIKPSDDLTKPEEIGKMFSSESDIAIEDCGFNANSDVEAHTSCVLPEQSAFQELSSSLPELSKEKDCEKETYNSGNSATESPSLKMMLKLKERYLLGNAISPEPSLSNAFPSPKIQITPSKLEPVVKSFLEVISEKQKMLSPAITPPSSSSSPVISSSDPSYVHGSSSWSRFSPVSSLGMCSTSPSPSGESKSSDICNIDKISDLQTSSDNNISPPVENSLCAELTPDVCEKISDIVAENNKICDENIESNIGEKSEVENRFLEKEESSCDLADGNLNSLSGYQEDHVHLINKEGQIKVGFEKESNPLSLNSPVSPRVVDVYSDASNGDIQHHAMEAANPDETHSQGKQDIVEYVENVELDANLEMQNIVNGNDSSVIIINEDRDHNVNNDFLPESKLTEGRVSDIIDESIFDNIDTKFITFRDKSKRSNSNSSSIEDEINKKISLENVNNISLVLDIEKDKETSVECPLPDIKMEKEIVNIEEIMSVKEGSSAGENASFNAEILSATNTELCATKDIIEQTLHLENKNELSQPKIREEEASKNDDDDSLGMLSNSTSSDSDTTPSLDESIYSTPQAASKPIPKHMSYLGHFAEHSFPFGGVRDSIDIRKSAMKKVPAGANIYNGSYIYDDVTIGREPAALSLPSSDTVKQPQEALATKETEKKEILEEIPFVDDESSQESPEQVNKQEQFFTPRTSYKRPLQRPLSMIETRCSSGSPMLAAKNNALPDTPLINPETFSTPGTMVEAIEDLRQLRTVERERARKLARERARLKSDEELGLRTVDYKKLRKKYQKTDSNASSDIQEEKSSTDESPVKGESMLHFLQSENVDMELSPDSVQGSEEAALPSLERFALSSHSQCSSPDSEVFESSLPPTSPCDNEKSSLSPASGSSDVVLQSSSIGSSTTASFSDVKKDSASNSGSASMTSKTDPAYLEPELSIEEVDLKISSGSNHKSTSSCSSLGNSPTKAKSSSLPGLMSRKDKTKSHKQDAPGTDKAEKSKPKERKSLLSIFTNFGKSDSLKSKSKEKDEKDKKKEKSPTPPAATAATDSLQAAEISHLEGAGLKVDGAPKESRFPKLRLARSKEKAKEKRKQKYLKESSPSPPKEGAPPVKEDTLPPAPKESTSTLPFEDSITSLRETSPPAKEIIPEKEIAAPPEEVNPPPTVKKVLLPYLEPSPQSPPGAKSAEMTFDRHAVIASLATISKQIPSGSKIGNGIAPQASEDSFSDPDDDTTEEKSHASSTCSSKKSKATSEDRKKKYERLAQRMYRQQEQKRLRTAQEIQRQLEELEVKQRELETRGVQVEKALRGEGEGQDTRKEEPELMQEWFHLVHSKNVLVRKEQEMMVKAKELELEDRHSRLQHQLHQRMAIDDSTKTQEEIDEEGRILAEMLEIVDQRDTLIALLEENRQIYQEQDRDLELSMQAKGLKFSSPTKS